MPTHTADLASILSGEIAAITPLDPVLREDAQHHLDSLTKPPGSLGRLEEVAARLYAVQGRKPLAAKPARMFTIAADHGVVAEGVASSPQAVTMLMVQNFLAGGAAINTLCSVAGAELFIVDAGVAGDIAGEHERLIKAKIAPGTANMAKGPAMSREECLRALCLGITLAETARREGVMAFGTGEMGIGNTTASSALLCAYMGFSAGEMTGMGAGVPHAGLEHKSRIIDQALRVNRDAVASGDALAVLAALGGFEIAALAGLILGGAARRMAVVVDGFISTAAYVAAWKMAPAVRDYCFFSHGSAEAGHARALAKLGEKPLLDLGMRLGEGTGAALGFVLLEAAAQLFNNMATFSSAGIDLKN
jgi:nicotinate-nucleotide--dimethylbenzimidazole phosphoribosyltransferase